MLQIKLTPLTCARLSSPTSTTKLVHSSHRPTLALVDGPPLVVTLLTATIVATTIVMMIGAATIDVIIGAAMIGAMMIGTMTGTMT
jgi:hypothetical protein